MPRPKDPTILTGWLSLWVDGGAQLRPAEAGEMPRDIADALIEGRLRVGARGVVGLALGQGLGGDDAMIRVDLPSRGLPLAKTFGLMAVGRVPGAQGELGVFGDSARDGRRWVAAFGMDARQACVLLGLGEPQSVHAAVFVACTEKTREKVRKDLWDAIKVQRGRWVE